MLTFSESSSGQSLRINNLIRARTHSTNFSAFLFVHQFVVERFELSISYAPLIRLSRSVDTKISRIFFSTSVESFKMRDACWMLLLAPWEENDFVASQFATLLESTRRRNCLLQNYANYFHLASNLLCATITQAARAVLRPSVRLHSSDVQIGCFKIEKKLSWNYRWKGDDFQADIFDDVTWWCAQRRFSPSIKLHPSMTMSRSAAPLELSNREATTTCCRSLFLSNPLIAAFCFAFTLLLHEKATRCWQRFTV